MMVARLVVKMVDQRVVRLEKRLVAQSEYSSIIDKDFL